MKAKGGSMDFAPPKKMVPISSRIPSAVRDKASALAKEKGIKESLIYRSIIVDFFSNGGTQKVDDKSTFCDTEGQPA
jgi:hypothetical protein